MEEKKCFGGLIGALITGLLSILSFFNVFESLNNSFVDKLYDINDPSQDIVIVAIDNESTEPFPTGLGRFSQWTRSNYVDLLSVLQDENPKVITFDIIFHTPSTMIPKSTLIDLEADATLAPTKDKIGVYEDFTKNYKSSLNDRRIIPSLKNCRNSITLFWQEHFQVKNISQLHFQNFP